MATFSVTHASGYEFLGYQWRKDGNPIQDGISRHGSIISGASTSSLSIANASSADAGSYDAIISNVCGEVTSDAANLVVNLCGDITADGLVNVNDLLAVINAWGPCPFPPQTCPADVSPPASGDGVVNVNDLLMVINNWG